MTRRERQRRKRRRNSGPSRIIFLTLGLIATAALIGAGGVVGWVISVANTAPPLDTSKPIELGATSRVYAADGTRLGFIQANELRTPVSSKEIPQNVKNAVVAVEDRRFFQHEGVDFEGIVRAGVKNLENRHEIQGGSTLTMQLVRNLYTGEKQRTLKRKIREAKLAEDLENLHPGREGKLWILTKYLNSVPFGTVGGQTAVGIQAGARIFFDKPASELKLREAALLAGLPQAPSQYNPFLNADAAKRRRDDVLQRMADQGYIKQATAERTKRMGLGVKRNRFYTSRREGYFFDFVKQELIDRYGIDTVRRGGLRIDTTLDLRMQRLARKTMDGNLGAPNRSAAIVTIDPRTGYIKAMASSSRYGDSKFNLAAQGHRQAGSTFKVMVLMAALRRGVDPNTTTYTSRPLPKGWLPTAPDYEVQTYSKTYEGRINLVRATLKSDNSVYAQLDADVGPRAVRETAYDMGIKTRLHAYPAEGLGGLTRGVSPLEMANAYATLAARGWRHRPIAVRKVRFPDGHVDNLGKPRRHRAFSDGVAYEATKILEQNVKSGTGYPNAAQIGCPAAGKTGTTDEFTDAWFVGYTPRLTTAVWLGHAKSRVPMPGVAGGTIPAKLWGQYMKKARGKFCGSFPKPKTPFQARPFFGRYSRGGGNVPPANGFNTGPPGAPVPGASGPATGGPTANAAPADNGRAERAAAANGNGGTAEPTSAAAPADTPAPAAAAPATGGQTYSPTLYDSGAQAPPAGGAAPPG
ncbi:MAG TPA: transglycosylase domain-containing protein [Solirubrobacteraceae bacterium]|nr:transglycosylase domain-containing protein [Solirubrobacteraceae bacterium]